MGGVANIDPHHEESDNNVGAFIMFVVKDACEFAGLLPKRKVDNAARLIKNALFKFNLLTAKTETLSKLMAQ